VAERLTCNQQIVFANRPANGFHLRTKFAGKSCVFVVECKLVDRAGKKFCDVPSIILNPSTF
jgi:hypothetical protein